jgi:TolB-like protein/Tfp pilus assembly protein PilF
MPFLGELKRRNVIRVGVAYLAVAWLFTEIASTLFPIFGIPEWGVRFIVLLFILGFLPALIFSWVYELTPEGLKREKEVVRDESTTHLTARRLDVITIALIVFALAFVSFDRIWLDESHTTMKAKPEVTLNSEDKKEVLSANELNQETRPSIAVLPFVNRSNNPEDAYFVDGIHDDLLGHIAKVGGIKAISRTSVLRYRNTDLSILEIANELGVTTILEGGIQRAGDQVRVNVQLIDAITDDHLWSDSYDRKLSSKNIFAIQTEIARAVATALKATLSPSEERSLDLIPTDSLAAYDHYLVGKQLIETRRQQDMSEAADRFNEAIDLDPEFALAWVGLATALQLQVANYGLPGAENLLKAENALHTALDLNDQLAEAHASMGLLGLLKSQPALAESSLNRAIELNPNYAQAYHWRAGVLGDLGRFAEARDSYAMAVQLNPMAPLHRNSYARYLRVEGRYEEALMELEKNLKIDPENAEAHGAIATMKYTVYKRYDEAVRRFSQLLSMHPTLAGNYIETANVYLDLAQLERAEQLVQRATELEPKSWQVSFGQSLLSVYSGDLDAAAELAKSANGGLGLTKWGWKRQFVIALLRNQALAVGDLSGALELYSSEYLEELTDPDPKIDMGNYRAAIDLALVLQKLGRKDEADLLLDRAMEVINSLHRLSSWGGYWVSDVQILALQGKRDEAITALQTAVDDGWRTLWWYYLVYDPNLDSIRSDPRFQTIAAEVKADMAEQMQKTIALERAGMIAPFSDLVTLSEH